jgi:murein DD-endopeptidase MepM/ murein hydrolase activator NlpD
MCLGCAAAQAPDSREALREAQLALLPGALAELPSAPFASQSFVYPLVGQLSSAFGWRNVSVNGNRYHAGVDWAAATGTPVRAARDGVVTRAGWWGTYGYAVALDHGDGSETRYAHLSAVHVTVGSVVRQGDVVGLVGSTGASTGPHLHFELRFGATAVDPLGYLEQPRDTATR